MVHRLTNIFSPHRHPAGYLGIASAQDYAHDCSPDWPQRQTMTSDTPEPTSAPSGQPSPAGGVS